MMVMEETRLRYSSALFLASDPDFNELSELAPEGIIRQPVTFVLRGGQSSSNEDIEVFERLGYIMVRMAVEEPSEWIENIQNNFESINETLNSRTYHASRETKIELNEAIQEDLRRGAELFNDQINYDQTIETSAYILSFCTEILENSKAAENINPEKLLQTVENSETLMKTATILDLQPYLLASLMISDQSEDLEFIKTVNEHITELKKNLEL